MITLIGSMFLAACVGTTSVGHLGIVLQNATFCVPDPKGDTLIAWSYQPRVKPHELPAQQVIAVGSVPQDHNIILINAPPSTFYVLGWVSGEYVVYSNDTILTCAEEGYVGGNDFNNLRAALAVGLIGGSEFADFRAAMGSACQNAELQ